MALIAREELQIGCRAAGQCVVHEVLSSGPDISDDRMDQLFEPLITSIEERTRNSVEREIDEYRGQREDNDRESKRQEIIAQRKAELEEQYKIYIMVDPDLVPHQSDSDTDTDSDVDPDWECASEWEYVHATSWQPRLPTKDTQYITVRKIRPQYSVEDLDDNDVMDESYNSDDYVTIYQVRVADIHMKQIFLFNINHEIDPFANHIMHNNLSHTEVLRYVDNLRDAGCDISYRTRDLVSFINVFMPALVKSITAMLEKKHQRRSRSRSRSRSPSPRIGRAGKTKI